MISFRFHVVSITAVFLALAIGVLVGSTYVDTAVADLLRSRIRTVEGNVLDARDENARLEQELDAAREYIDLSSQYAVTDRLTDTPALIVAARGVDESAVDRTVTLARQAGGTVPGVLWLEPRWAAEGDGDLDALGSIVGGSVSDTPEDLQAMAWSDITDELAAEPTSDEDLPAGQLGEESGGTGSVLADLEEAGFVTLDPVDDDSVSLDDLVGAGPRMLVITGARAQEEVTPVIPVAVEAMVDAGLVTVVGDVYVVDPEAPERASTLLDTFDEDLRGAIVIVDHADLDAGRVAAVLALDSAGDGQVGLHYGYGDGADAVLPTWTPP
jgi:hypothetical protein